MTEESGAMNVKIQTAKESAFGSRFNLYRLPFAAWAYNNELREWEVYETDREGVIQDLEDRYATRGEAEAAAARLSAKLTAEWAEVAS